MRLPKGPKIEKCQDPEIFKRDRKIQASHPPNPYFLWGILRAARVQNEFAPEKFLNRYEKRFEKREKGSEKRSETRLKNF